MRIPVTVVPAAGCDCSRCDLFIGNPNAIEPVCSGSNTDCSYCGCARQRDCGECPIRCGSRVDITAWMADIGGTVTFDDISLPGLEVPAGLPQFVPQVDTANVAELDHGLDWPAYAIGLRRVFSAATSKVVPGFTNTTARDALGIGDRLAVLVAYGTDPLVEALWTKRSEVTAALAECDWDLVLAPNFSMYGNQPRTEHLINFRRNLVIAEEFCAAGINAVPNLYWYRLEDLERYEQWLADVVPPAVAINLQTFRTDDDWNNMALPGLTFLSMVLPAATKMIVTGTSRRDRLASLTALFGSRLVVVSQNPVQYARHGAVMGAEGRVDIHATVPDAFASTVRYYDSLLSSPPGTVAS